MLPVFKKYLNNLLAAHRLYKDTVGITVNCLQYQARPIIVALQHIDYASILLELQFYAYSIQLVP